MDIVTRFFQSESCDIHLNHGDLLEAIWSWTGIKPEHRQKVSDVWLQINLLVAFYMNVHIFVFDNFIILREASLFVGFFASSVV